MIDYKFLSIFFRVSDFKGGIGIKKRKIALNKH